MRALIWSPNYAPEPTGIPPLVTDAAEWLAAQDHEVDVVTAMPNYPERRIHPEYRGIVWRSEERNGVRIHRSWLRARSERSLLDKALYEASISTFALPNAVRLARRADVIVCVIPTLLAAAYAAALARGFSKRLVLWVQDLVLDAAASVDDSSHTRRVLAAVRRVEYVAANAADSIVVCSPGFKDYFVRQGIAPAKIETVYNWADVDWIEPGALSANGHTARFLYAGNVGYTQGFETLVDAARIGGDGVTVEIVGAGNARARVEELASSVPNVVVRDPVPRSNFPRLLASADAHVVLQRRISAGANLPSKIATYMASGRPIVASLDLDTPAAHLLRKSGGAVLVEPESAAALADAMRDLAIDAAARRRLGARARAYAEAHLAKRPALERLEAAFFG